VFGTPLPMATVVGPAAALKASGAFVAPWLGCRCSWPCTQLCWFYLLGSQFLQWVAVVVAVLTIVFQVLLLESMIVANFLAEVPHTTTWYEWWTLDEPWLPRLIWLLGKVIVFWFMIGNAVNFDDSQSFLASPEIRLLLRSLANRFEGQTYAYCTVVLWTIISEFATVIVVSYFALVSAIIINVESTGNALGDATIIFLIFDFIPAQTALGGRLLSVTSTLFIVSSIGAGRMGDGLDRLRRLPAPRLCRPILDVFAGPPLPGLLG